MAKLINIVETPEAITAEAVSLVWEAYEAPRKRVPRARIVEHRFTVSIPKVSEDAAPLAFVVEHFPQMTLDYKEYRAGYDQPIRWYAGEFYTPARYTWRNYVTDSRPTAKSELESAIYSAASVAEYTRDEYAEAIARHDIKANQYPARYPYAEDVKAQHHLYGLLVIGTELYAKCQEPVYVYNPADTYNAYKWPAHISTATDEDGKHGRATYGALDYLALAFYQADTARDAFIDVKMPELVSYDRTRASIEKDIRLTQANMEQYADEIETLEMKLENARGNLGKLLDKLDEQVATLEAYKADPLAYWEDRAGDAANSAFHSQRRGAERIRRELAKEA